MNRTSSIQLYANSYYTFRRLNDWEVIHLILLIHQKKKRMTTKQVVAIDVANLEIVCLFATQSDLRSETLKDRRTFPNNSIGFTKLYEWSKKLSEKNVSLDFIFEATGIYHEKLAHWLNSKRQNVSIILPTTIANYAKTLNQKTITDKKSADVIAYYGLRHVVEYWKPADPIFRQMKQLTRERDQIIAERTMVKNQLHAEKKEAIPLKNSIKRMENRINFLKKQEKAIETELKNLIKAHDVINTSVKRIMTIPGIGLITAAVVLAETNGFELIKNRKQIASYAGLDVVLKQSGTSVNRKPKISKKGNKYLRKAFHLPAFAAVMHNGAFREKYDRHLSKHGIKMKAYVPIQRKLLELCYTLDKCQSDFDDEYHLKGKALQIAEPLESSI